MTGSASLLLLMLLSAQQGGAVSGNAGAERVGVEQLGTGQRTDVVGSEQITTRSREVPAAPVVIRSSASSQLTEGKPQVNTSQLTSDKPTADAPVSGSTTKQGRNVRAEILRGDDRCDPQNSAERDEACDRVIETRSAEFSAPDVQPLSPEQNLMVRQQSLADSGRDLNSATRRLANGEIDSSNAHLAVSAMALVPPKPAEEEKPGQDMSANDAIVSAIVSGMQGTPYQ
ncbi:hypothetical protein [Asticcacaulis tiandongensis]|uniref:hypothetical protein n=1 Tax=Asticcacaulis tiandongensis TaxID=2565365 RepID=UPI00112E5F63|nr:hypothetical protein [Asticcacaulis tiandongensis]